MTGIDLGGPLGLAAPTTTTDGTEQQSPPPRLSPPVPDVDSHFDDQSSQGSSISLHPPTTSSSQRQLAAEVLAISTPRLQQNDLTPPSSNASLAQLDDPQTAHPGAKPILQQSAIGASGVTGHDVAATRPGSHSPHSLSSHEGLAGRKRTATGDFKIAPPSVSQKPEPRGHVRSTSTVSNASCTNVSEISSQLRTKLKYAMIKVQNGWQSRSLDELESIATDSPRSTMSGFQHLPDQPAYLASPGVRASPSSYRKWSDSSSSEIASLDALGSTPNANSRLAPLSQPTIVNGRIVRALAPPVDIKPGAARRKPSPNDGIALLGLTASPNANGFSPAVRPSASQRTPSQNAAMEADAVETLLFMASPNNSGYRPSTTATASQESSLRSTLNSHTSPLRTRLSQISTSSPKRVAFQDHTGPPLFKTREAQIDYLLDNMSDGDSEDDLDSLPIPPRTTPHPSTTSTHFC